jgi:DNA-binding response OmpR family regulator
MKIFLENPGKAFSRDELLNLVWGVNFFGDPKIVDVNIRRLRSKIEDSASTPRYIETVWGTGYRWKK